MGFFSHFIDTRTPRSSVFTSNAKLFGELSSVVAIIGIDVGTNPIDASTASNMGSNCANSSRVLGVICVISGPVI